MKNAFESDQTVAVPPPNLTPETVVGMFEATWQNALRGGPVPSLNDYPIGDGPDSTEIRRQLDEVEIKYRRLYADNGGFADGPVDPDTNPNLPALTERTIEYADRPMPTVDLSADQGTVSLDGQASADTDSEAGPDHRPEAVAAAQSGAPPGYEIRGVLGRGGMGVVYDAVQTSLKRRVALKMVTAGAHAAPAQRNRFQIEAEAVAALQHPNIVQIYEIGEHHGVPYFSLEFVGGGILQKKVKHGPMPPREAAEMARLLAGAMAYAHNLGIIHRDLKPANVLLTPDGQPKIADFGLAKRVDETDSSQTQAGTILGTPSYMAPEQAEGEIKEIGPLADVYSLGALLYHLLTGRPPFQGTTMLETLEMVRTLEPVPVRQLQHKVPRDLETICLKCLQKDPRKRYATAEALARDLGHFLAGEPIEARPVGPVERLWRWCRRNPKLAGLTTSVAILMTSVGILAVITTIRAGRERAAVAEAGNMARERLQQAADAISMGDTRRAQDILNTTDPLVATAPALVDIRTEWAALNGRVAWLVDFKKRIDKARYAGLFASQGAKEAQRLCKLARDLCPRAEAGGRDGEGPPPLNPVQEQLLREDVFDVYLISGEVEWKLASAAGTPDAQREAARRNLEWLDRAAAVLPPTRTLYARRAVYHTALGEMAAADEDERQVEATPPTSAVDRFWQGVAERLLGEADRAKVNEKPAVEHYRRAAAAYVEVLRLRPDHFWAYFEWATCQVRLNAQQEALVALTACTHIKPDAPWPYYNRGTILLNLKQYDSALQDFDRTLELDNDYAEAYVNRGQCLAALGNHARAVADFTHVIDTWPDGYPKAYRSRVQSYIDLKRYREARDDYSILIRLQENRPEHVFGRGKMNILLKDYDAALSDFQRTTRRIPKNEAAYYYCGVIHLGRRQYDQALTALDQAISIKPEFSKPYLARAQLRLWEGRPNEALEDVNRGLANLPPDKKADVLNDRADVYRALGKFGEAAADYRDAIKADPRGIDSSVGLALVLEKLGQPEQARECYKRLLAADPNSASARLRRAEYFRNHKQFDEALADCDEAARLDKDSVLPGLVRAGILAARGDDATAVAVAERLLRQATPGDGHVLYAAACVWGLAAQAAGARPDGKEAAKRYGDRAADLLTETLDRGWHDLQYEEHNRMPDDPALASLRQHPRVRELFGQRWK
jgi:tetratricopeptide (TPR) repeat protein